MWIWYTPYIYHFEITDFPCMDTIAERGRTSASECEWMVPGTVDPTLD